jgi:FtsH-binding integral membrane protein
MSTRAVGKAGTAWRRLQPHVHGVWQYLRVGLIVAAATVLVGGMMALSRGQHLGAVVLTLALAAGLLCVFLVRETGRLMEIPRQLAGFVQLAHALMSHILRFLRRD